MTLVVAAQSADFVVLGSDSRGTKVDDAGNRTQVNFITKIYNITEFAGILLFGNTDQAVYLLRKFKKTIKNKKENVTKIAEQFADFCRKEAEKVKDVPTINLPFFGFIITGLDKSGSSKFVPNSFSLNSHSGFRLGQPPLEYAINGKDIIADYLFIKHYKKNMDLDKLCELVAHSLDETMQIDGDVGGQIQMAIIDKDGFRNLHKPDIEKFVKNWT